MRHILFRHCAGLILALASCLPSYAGGACTLDRATGTTMDAEPLLRHGYNLRWNAATDRIAFMEPGIGGHYRIFTARPDASDRQAITAARPEIPRGHQGEIYWHPSGRYLLFTAQHPDWPGGKLFGIPDYGALPGFGVHDDLWLITADGSRAWQLLSEPESKTQGILLPVFSPDGKRIAWSDRQPDKSYRLMVADFVETPTPHLENSRAYRPGNGNYFEPGSFSSDGSVLVYSSDEATHNFWRSQIHRLDLASGASTRLSRGNDYNEHPTVVRTPGGDWVVYMSTKGEERQPLRLQLGTDWWAMRLDGGGAKRLTTMNLRRSPENTGEPQVAGTVAVSPAGDYMLGDVQDSLAKQTGMVRVVRFTCPESMTGAADPVLEGHELPLKRVSGPPLRWPRMSHSVPSSIDLDCNVDAAGSVSGCAVTHYDGFEIDRRAFSDMTVEWVESGNYTPVIHDGTPINDPHHHFHIEWKLQP